MCKSQDRTPSADASGGTSIWRQMRRGKRLLSRRRSSSLSSSADHHYPCDGKRSRRNSSCGWMLVDGSRYILSSGLAYSNTASRYFSTFFPVALLYWGLCEARKRGCCAAKSIGKRSYSSIRNYVAVSDTQPFDDAVTLTSDDDDYSTKKPPPMKRRHRLLNRLRFRRRVYDQQPAARSPWNVPLLLVFYQFLPLRALSRAWGWVNDVYLPWMLRVPVLGLYVWSCGCNLGEAECSDLTRYRNLGMFFRRRLRAGIRPINTSAALVSPADGQVIHFGRVESDQIEQVKGLTYSLAAFLGPQSWKEKTIPLSENNADTTPNADEKKCFAAVADETYRYELCHHHHPSTMQQQEQPSSSVDNAGVAGTAANDADECQETDAEQNKGHHAEDKERSSTSLYHCIIYLSPGDYHRFHSPTEWQVFYRRHFPGTLFSVSPRVCRYIEGLFNFNERVAYIGKWAYGFFATIAVGATNVGTIKVHFDERLRTNAKQKTAAAAYEDFDFRTNHHNNYVLDKSHHIVPVTTHSTDQTQDPCVAGNEEFTFPLSSDNHVMMQRGVEWGEFRLGSTIVMLFEAPTSFAFCLDVNQKIKLGEPIGFIASSNSTQKDDAVVI